MTHLEMKRFKAWLDIENAKRLEKGVALIEPFYPYDFLKNSQDAYSDRRLSGTRAGMIVSDDLSNFVFLKTTKADVHHLVHDPLNLDSRIRLMYYLDTDGKEAVVSDKIMRDFFEACLKYRGRFEITPSIDGIETMDKVEIKTGPFAGHEASVVHVRHTKGAIHLDLAIQMVSGVMNIQMSNVSRNQVTILNRSSVDAIRNDFIEYTQNHLLTIIEHRVKRVEDSAVNQRDAVMLTRLFRYRDYRVDNEAAENHFLALMLICAHLCRYVKDEEKLKAKVLERLEKINQKSESKAATDTRAYLWISLYIVTHDPSYREAVKHYVRAYQPKSRKLRRFVSLIRTGKKI